MECSGVLRQLSILTAAVQLPFEKAGLLGKTAQCKPTLAIKAYGVPIFTLHILCFRAITKSNFASHHSAMLLASDVQYSHRYKVLKKTPWKPKLPDCISIIETLIDNKLLFCAYKLYNDEHTTCILGFLSALEINWEIRRYGVETSLQIYCITAFAAAVPEFVSQ